MRIVFAILGAAALATILGLGVLVISSRLSLDDDYRHTQATAALPLLAQDTSAGLVRIPARGMEFRARVAGLAGEGPALVLLHGFPETSIMWEPLIAAASSAGFRVLAFDQRGYSPGARPDSVDDYQLRTLTEDVFAVADAAGFEHFHLVGHDWGSIVGWDAAARRDDRVLSYASLSIPHPGAIGTANADRGSPAYVKFFRMEGVPETILTAGGLFLMQNVVYGLIPADQRAEYLSVFSEPGALQAAFAWYRAVEASVLASTAEVSQPVLYVFGNQDMPVFVRPEVRALQSKFVTGAYEEIEFDAGHWLIEEKPDEIVEVVMAHLRAQAL